MNIGLIFGGRSAEYEISLLSAKSIYEKIDKESHAVYLIGISKKGDAYLFEGSIERVADGRWIDEVSDAEVVFYGGGKKPGIYRNGEVIVLFDLFFPIMHGPFGEDGKIQGLLELSGLPYVGCSVLASALTMDKELSKRIFALEGIRQAKYLAMSVCDDLAKKAEEAEQSIGYPCFVKPANMGSTIGISKAKNRKELDQAIEAALLYDDKVLVEQAIHAREIEVAVLGNREDISVSVVGEILPSFEFYDYDAKYKSGESKLLIPAPLSKSESEHIRTIAEKAYLAVGAEGLSRVDFFMDKDTGAIYINEINSMPGFTTISMYPKLWEYTGVSYEQLVQRLMDLAIARKERENKKQ